VVITQIRDLAVFYGPSPVSDTEYIRRGQVSARSARRVLDPPRRFLQRLSKCLSAHLMPLNKCELSHQLWLAPQAKDGARAPEVASAHAKEHLRDRPSLSASGHFDRRGTGSFFAAISCELHITL